jgi:hypothetical protein
MDAKRTQRNELLDASMKYLIPLLLVLCGTVSAQVLPSQPTNTILGNGGAGNQSPTPQTLGTTLQMASSIITTIQPINPSNGGSCLNTGSYTMTQSDAGSIYTTCYSSSFAISFPQAGSTGFNSGTTWEIKNNNGGASGYTSVVVTPTTSTINGQSSLKIPPQTSCVIVSDGTNYQTTSCTAAQGQVTFVTYTIAQLPTCNSSTNQGSFAAVSNGVSTPTYLAVPSTTGSTYQPVFCDGVSWKYH